MFFISTVSGFVTGKDDKCVYSGPDLRYAKPFTQWADADDFAKSCMPYYGAIAQFYTILSA